MVRLAVGPTECNQEQNALHLMCRGPILNQLAGQLILLIKNHGSDHNQVIHSTGGHFAGRFSSCGYIRTL